MNLLRAEGLRRVYGGRTVLDVDDLGVDAGEVLAVLGPNGAGKSTLFRLLLAVEAPDAGRVLLRGRSIAPGVGEARRHIAGVFQRPYLFAGTVEANVAYGLKARGAPRTERERRVAEVLDLLDLAPLARESVYALSGGEAQRVALARALAPRPEVLLLDEPTANLDVTVRRRFREDLERLIRAHAGAVVLITHDPADAFALADRIAVIEEGRIVQTDEPDRIVLHPATPFVAAFTGAELLLDGTVAGWEDELLVVSLGGVGEPCVVAATAAALPPGTPVNVAYRPEDVVLTRLDARAETSAQNRVRVRVAALSPSGGLVRVRLEGDVALTALVTRRAAAALELAPGSDLVAQLKATAVRVYVAG